jgi:hypothetical protein
MIPAGAPVYSPGEIGGIAFHCDCRPAAPPPVVQWHLEFRADPAARGPSDVQWWPATMSWHEPGQVVLVHDPVPGWCDRYSALCS